MVRGHYGEYRILVDGETVVDGGALAFLGVLPSVKKTVANLRERLATD